MDNSYISFLLHMSKPDPEFGTKVARHLRALLDIFRSDGLLSDEDVTVYADDCGHTMPKLSSVPANTPDESKSWIDKVKGYGRGIQYIVASIYQKSIGSKRIGTVSLRTYVCRSQTYHSPMIKDEQVVIGMMHQKMWARIDKARFQAAILEACVDLGISYAAIDNANLGLDSIYHGNFRVLAADGLGVDPETRLPGICWAQYLSTGFIARNPGLSEIPWNQYADQGFSDEIGFSIESIRGATIDDLKGFWVQLTPEIKDAVLAYRMKFRRFFSGALYKLSLQRFADLNCHRDNCTIDLSLIPLFPEETEALKGIVPNPRCPWMQ